MKDSRLRAQAARSVLDSVPMIMRTVGRAVRHGGSEVSAQQYRLLNVIGFAPRTPTLLARIQGVTPATATATVNTLEQRGWVSREHDSDDRRRVIVSLTDEGRAVLDRAQMVEMVRQCAGLHRAGRDVIIVTSGAIAAGRERLGMSDRHFFQ